MKSINIEMLMGHYIGVSTSYYKPTEKEVLADYLKAVELLTFDPANKNTDKIKAEIRNEFEQMDLKIQHQQNEHRKEILMIKLSNVINRELERKYNDMMIKSLKGEVKENTVEVSLNLEEQYNVFVNSNEGSNLNENDLKLVKELITEPVGYVAATMKSIK